MDQQVIYVALKHESDYDALVTFLQMIKPLSIKKIEHNMVKIIDNDPDLTFDLYHARELAMQELYFDFKAFLLPQSPHFDVEPILPILPKLNPGIYSIEQLIPELVFHQFLDIKTTLKNYYFNLCGNETIHTVLGFIDADLNASKAAKLLYMHRNTLNYRIDSFTKISGIDPRHFAGALAVYLLFQS